MFLNRWTLVLAAGLLVPACACAQSDSQAYCAYVMDQPQAQRDLLRTPTALAGYTQPETGLPMQVVGGATLGLADVKKAALTMDVARKNCELYKTTADAQQAIQYAIPVLEKEALTNRLTLIDRAMQSLNTLMDKTSRMIEAQNATRPMLFNLQTTKIKLEADRADTQSKISALYAPQLSDKPLDELMLKNRAAKPANKKLSIGSDGKTTGMSRSPSASISKSTPSRMARSLMAKSPSTTISQAAPSTAT